MGYPAQYGYYGGYGYGQHAAPQQAAQPAQPAAAQTTDSAAWDPAAVAAYYQTQGWGGYYCTLHSRSFRAVQQVKRLTLA